MPPLKTDAPPITLTVAPVDGVMTVTSTSFACRRSVCVNVSGPDSDTLLFRRYVPLTRDNQLNAPMPEVSVPGIYKLRATQVGPNPPAPVSIEFTK